MICQVEIVGGKWTISEFRSNKDEQSWLVTAPEQSLGFFANLEEARQAAYKDVDNFPHVFP